MKKNTYRAVATTIFDDGRSVVRYAGTTSDYFKPENKCSSTSRADRYIDWFDSEEEANEFIKENTL